VGNIVQFSVLKSQICAKSHFFKIACKPGWKSGQARIITLDDDDPKTFALFLAWVLTGQIESADNYIEVSIEPGTTHYESSDIKRNIAIQAQWDQLCTCFVYGDVLQAPSFQNQVIDLLVTNSRMHQLSLRQIAGSREDTLQYIYQHTTRGSSLRQLVIDSIITSSAHEIPNYDFSSPFISEHLVDLATYAISEAKSSRLRGKPCNFKVPWKNAPCRYHVHPDQPIGYSCTENLQRQDESCSPKKRKSIHFLGKQINTNNLN
jgi:hypothetical protein